MLTQAQLDTWERKLRYEFEATLSYLVKRIASDDITVGSLTIQWTENAFDEDDDE